MLGGYFDLIGSVEKNLAIWSFQTAAQVCVLWPCVVSPAGMST